MLLREAGCRRDDAALPQARAGWRAHKTDALDLVTEADGAAER